MALMRILFSPLNLIADIVSELTPPRLVEGCGFVFNTPGLRSQETPLGPKQLKFCDENFGRFQGFAVMRRQAERSRA